MERSSTVVRREETREERRGKEKERMIYNGGRARGPLINQIDIMR